MLPLGFKQRNIGRSQRPASVDCARPIARPARSPARIGERMVASNRGGENPMTILRCQLMASVAGLVLVGAASSASADQLLTGSITSASGQKLEGVQVSAKQDGSTITTSVYTDLNGEYFFPAMADGKYRVWAQALGFETSKGEVELTATKHQDFKLAAITDPEERFRQLPPEMMVAALPDATPEDANIKKIFTNECTGCH